MGGAGSFEVLVSFEVLLAAADTSAVVVEFGSLAFPDGFGPCCLYLLPHLENGFHWLDWEVVP